MNAREKAIEGLRRDVARGADSQTVRRLLRLLIDVEESSQRVSRFLDERPMDEAERKSIESDLENAVYLECVAFFEPLESGGHLGGNNGHHMAQAAASVASDFLREGWRKDA